MDDAALGPVKDSPSVKASSFPCVLSFCKSRKAIRELNNIQQQEEKTAAASHGFANRNLSGPVFTPRVPLLRSRTSSSPCTHGMVGRLLFRFNHDASK
jgi:hypothetical protein